MIQPHAARSLRLGMGPFFRTDPLADLLGDPGVDSSDSSEEDLDDAPSGVIDSDEEDRTRPGEYPESEYLDEDQDEAVSEEEEDDLSDDEVRGEVDEDRSWKSIAREKERRLRRIEGQKDELVAQLLAGAGPSRAPEAKPEPPPHTMEAIALDFEEGRAGDALRKMQQLDGWKERKLRVDLSVESDQRAQVQRLENHMRSNLNFRSNTPFAHAVREKAEDLIAEFPGLSQEQASLYAAGLVGEQQSRGPKQDLRGETKRRKAKRAPAKDGRGRSTAKGSTAERVGANLTNAQKAMLEKHGLFKDYGRPFKDSRREARRQAKVSRLLRRIEEVQGGE